MLLTSVKIPSGGPAKPGSGEHPYATARRFYFGGTGECGPKRQVGPKHPERALCLNRDRTFGKHGKRTATSTARTPTTRKVKAPNGSTSKH